MAAAAAPAAAAAAAARRPASRVAVVPVPGDRFAPAGTSVTFLGVHATALGRLTVVGSKSGAHHGTVLSLGATGSAFVPARPFSPGEQVTVTLPGARIPGGDGDRYRFGVAVPAPRAEAATALRVAARMDGPPAASRRAPAPRQPQCEVVRYHSLPGLHAQQACMDLGVTTSGTAPGTYLFLPPESDAGTGAGIFSDEGNLIWWLPGGLSSVDSAAVFQYRGAPYLAVWSGTATTYGQGVVTLYNEHYQVVGKVAAAGRFPAVDIDLHEFQITPAGDAVFGIYEAVQVSIGGTQQTVLQYVVQKVSLVQDATGIHTGSLLFEWDSLTDVPTSQSKIPDRWPAAPWDYLHGNAITQDTDGNLVLSGRNTWGIYKVDDTVGDGSFGHVVWQLGATGDNTLSTPWCFQHNITALGSNTYSLYDDGGIGPGCLPGSTQHPARALVISVDPSKTPAAVTLVSSYTHNPPIYTGFTGSAQVLAGGDVLVDWADFPQVTEFSSSGAVRMDLQLSAPSYRGFRYPWVGTPATPPALALQRAAGATTLWVSWNGSTEVAAWQVLTGGSASSLVPYGRPVTKTGFETTISVPTDPAVVAVEALSATGAPLASSAAYDGAGYALATSAAAVAGAGNAATTSSPGPGRLHAPAVGIAATPDGAGHWVVAADGGVFTSGDARFHGSLGAAPLASQVVGMAATPDGGGYWLVTAAGQVTPFGDARAYGSLSRLNSPIVSIAATSDGRGYWLVASDGGVFALGDARFRGSLGSRHLNAPVVGAAPTTDGLGYWLVAADGGIFTFGDAKFYGSGASLRLTAPVVGMALDPFGGGYWLASSDGSVVGLGTASPYDRPAAASPPARTVGISAAP